MESVEREGTSRGSGKCREECGNCREGTGCVSSSGKSSPLCVERDPVGGLAGGKQGPGGLDSGESGPVVGPVSGEMSLVSVERGPVGGSSG